MKTSVGLAIATIAQLTIAAPATGAITWNLELTNEQESPVAAPLTFSNGAPRPKSFGTAVLVLNDAQTALSYTINVFNIDFTGLQTADNFDNLTAAHFHAGPSPALTQGVRFGFIGMPFNDTNPGNTVVTPFATGVGGTVVGTWDVNEGNGGTTLTAQLPNILAGRAYLNFHTVQFGGGEVRGNIVPEPATWMMMIGGFGLVGGAMRSARRNRVKLAAA